MDLRQVFKCMISVSELGRGQASRVIQAVEENKNSYIVVKNNKPQAVIISIDEYSSLLHANDILKSMNPIIPEIPSPVYHNPHSISPDSLTEEEVSMFFRSEEND